jgi:hypothetical protein
MAVTESVIASRFTGICMYSNCITIQWAITYYIGRARANSSPSRWKLALDYLSFKLHQNAPHVWASWRAEMTFSVSTRSK